MRAVIDRICVFCGSNNGSDPAYVEAARSLGQLLAREGIALVYGGGSVGLMGELADAVLASGGRVVGVIPHALWAREVGHRGLTDLHIVDTMHERKAMMADLADAFIALPGGLGTLEEIFEIWTWAQLGLHAKPLGFLDVNGFYEPLMGFLDRAVREQFVKDPHRAIALIDRDPAALLARFDAWTPPRVEKWITREET
ncbi:MAG: TIGR00730 family Rossman fold protein [Acidobacteria bacterium]|nr:TIGR00730 family Rossman fold protein [Acidobacteriota bacterium]MBV9478868.1 TIGR00730 family Rossman fold protein [Acidobacteriota bacterium]